MLAFTLEPIRLVPNALRWVDRQSCQALKVSRDLCAPRGSAHRRSFGNRDIKYIFEYDNVSLSVTLHLTHYV